MTIPKLIHRIWLGDAPMHPRFIEWGVAWKSLHPEWKILEWHEKELVALGVHDKAMLTACCHNAQRANIWRLLILEKLGGVYVDTDVQPLRNIEPLLDDSEAVASPFFVQRNSELKVNNAFLACVPRHPWITECVTRLVERDPGVTLSMGSSHVTAVLTGHPDVKVLDRNDIYQNPIWHTMEAMGRKPDPRWYAIHHFSYCWYPTGFSGNTGR